MSLDLPEKKIELKNTVVNMNRRKDDLKPVAEKAQPSLSEVFKAIDFQKSAFQQKFSPEKHRENMRGRITVIIVGTFGLCMLAVVLTGLYKIADKSVTLEQAQVALKMLGDLLSSHVVPIITLVLGFYFGSEKRQ